MGKKDDYQYDYLDNYVRFADQVNGALFGGRQVVKPDELEPADAQVLYVIGNCCSRSGTPTRIANAILAKLAAGPTFFTL